MYTKWRTAETREFFVKKLDRRLAAAGDFVVCDASLRYPNAIQSLPSERTQRLRVVTLGCPVGENVAGEYHQYLGLFDALGQLNSWRHRPDHRPPTWHSTNPVLPPAMAAGEITSEALRG